MLHDKVGALNSKLQLKLETYPQEWSMAVLKVLLL